MPSKVYTYLIADSTRLVVYFNTEKGEVTRFVVKLEHGGDGYWREVIRYDCFHGYVHKDVLGRMGRKTRVIRFQLLDPTTGLNAAIADCVENAESYVERWQNG